MGEGLVNGRVLYYDPNGVRVGGSNDNSIFNMDLTKDPEDLSIAVDLQVVTRKRGSAYSEENGTTTTWSLIGSGTKVNFLGGTNLDGGKNSNVLTDFFSNIGDKKDGLVENLPEAMCVNSIDIEFSSWYAASVVIVFTDVRGAALFSSVDYIDYLKDNNQPVKDGYESFYKTFFSFPYPMYKLKVKGFYGDAVTYPLHCSDFKAQFNSSTGNFDVTVNFIGYTYAMLNDVLMPYLIASPYCEYEGKNYWESQVSAGRFISSEGNQLPTLYELITKIKNGNYEIEKISHGKLSSNLELTKAELSSLQNIFEKIYGYLYSVKNSIGGEFETGNKYILKNIPNNKQSILNDILLENAKTIDGLISEFKTKFTNSTVFVEYTGLDDLTLKIKDNNKTINLTRFSDIFISEEVRFNNLIKTNLENLEVEKNNTLTNAYGMASNIFNYFKVLVAHMETFYHMIETCSKKIGTDREFGNIPFDGTDGNVQINKNNKPILSPFPWVTKKGSFNRLEDEWIGNYDSNLEEVKLIESLIKSKTELKDKIDKLLKSETPDPSPSPNDLTGLTIGELWLPIHPFDNSINLIGGKNTAPWANIKSAEQQVIYDRLYLRTLIPTLFKTDDTISTIEAYNIYDQTKGDRNIGHKIQSMILELDNGYKVGNKITKGGFNNINKLLETKVENGGVEDYFTIPFFEDDKNILYNKLNENECSSLRTTNKKWFYDTTVKSLSGKYNPNTLYKTQERYKIVKDNYINAYSDKINDNYIKPLTAKVSQLSKNGNVDSAIVNILKNYIFTDKTGEIITYSYLNDNKSIINNFTKNRLDYPYSNINGYNGKAFKTAGISLPVEYKFVQDLDIDNLQAIYKEYGSTEIENGTDTKKKYDRLSSSEKEQFFESNTYPMIGGYETVHTDYLFDKDVNTKISLFGHPFYYAQTQQKGNADDFLTAYLFLNTLNLNMVNIESIIVNNTVAITEENCYERSGFMARLPFTGVLLIGGILWRYFETQKKHDFFNYGYIKTPKVNQYFRVNQIFTLDHTNNNYDESSLFIERKVGDTTVITPVLDYVECKFFTDMFVKFVLGKWMEIKNSLELKIKTNTGGRRMLVKDFDVIFENINNIIKEKNAEGVTNDKIINLFYHGETNTMKNYVTIGVNKIKTDKVIAPEIRKKAKSLVLIHKDKTDVIKKVMGLIMEDCVLTYSGNLQKLNTNNQIIKQQTALSGMNSIYKSLLLKTNFASELGLDNSLAPDNNKNNIVSVDYNEDLRLATYTYIKTLYDKWVSGWLGKNGQPYKWIISEPPPQNSDLFKAIPNTVNQSFIKNFRFIDRAHNDIGVDMLINYRNAISGLIDGTIEKTLFSAMTDVLQQNSMLFLPMPSYQSFNTIDDLEKVFKPIPFSGSKMVSDDGDLDSAMYLCMYAGRPSSRLNLGTNGALADDGYPLNSPNTPTDYNSESDSKVPAIAVNFGQQNQQYFKNFGLNMSNPNTTDASINVLKNLNERANQNSTVEPIGQDMFSLYSQYSYTCDVEMMGCTQIQPMMYFQLGNVPMWNGAYMIYKVKHSIKPGNMTTSFTGMRMAKTYPKLIKQNMLTFKLTDGLSGLNDDLSATTGGDPNKMISFTKDDYFRKDVDQITIGGYTNSNIRSEGKIPENIYNILKNYTSVMVEEICREWDEFTNNKHKLYVFSGYRKRGTEGEAENSVHPLGLAVDLKIRNQEYNKDLNRTLQNFIKEKMTKGFRVDQVIFEKKSTYWVHVGFADPSGSHSPTIIDGQYKTRGQYFDIIVGNTSKAQVIPQAVWPNKDIPAVKIEDSGKAGNTNVQSVLSYFKNNTTLNNAQIAGIMGNIYQESKFIADISSKKTSKEHSYGLVQWNSKYYPSKDSTIEELRQAAGKTIQSQLNFLVTTDGYKKTFIGKTKNSNSPEECAKIFCQFYERPDDMEHQKELRAGFARYYYNNVVNK